MGNTKWGDIELKRGVDQDKTLWNWRKLIVDGKLKESRKDCQVTMLDYEGSPVVTYSIINAWPKKYTGVGLKADSNEVAVEDITPDMVEDLFAADFDHLQRLYERINTDGEAVGVVACPACASEFEVDLTEIEDGRLGK